MKTLTRAILMVGIPDNVPDIRYITGFSTGDPVIYLQRSGQKHLVVPDLDLGRALRVARGLKVRAMSEFGGSAGRARPLAARVLSLLREQGVNSVTVGADFPIGVAKKLQRFDVGISVAEDALFPSRAVKTPREICRIKECQGAAVKAMRTAISMIAGSRADRRGYLRRGAGLLTAGMVRRAIDIELLENDCAGLRTIVVCGRGSAEPHGQGSGPLRSGASIVIDIFPRSLVHGYWGDLTRTVVKGKANPALRNMYAAVLAAQAAALSKIKAGVACATVHAAAVNEFERRWFRTGMVNGRAQGFIHSTGHGLGLAVHEAPRISTGPGRLRAGNVITVEPGLYYHDTGGVRIEDLVVVTKKGWKYIGKCGKMLEIR